MFGTSVLINPMIDASREASSAEIPTKTFAQRKAMPKVPDLRQIAQGTN